jgi:hypothetical protein
LPPGHWIAAVMKGWAARLGVASKLAPIIAIESNIECLRIEALKPPSV